MHTNTHSYNAYKHLVRHDRLYVGLKFHAVQASPPTRRLRCCSWHLAATAAPVHMAYVSQVRRGWIGVTTGCAYAITCSAWYVTFVRVLRYIRNYVYLEAANIGDERASARKYHQDGTAINNTRMRVRHARNAVGRTSAEEAKFPCRKCRNSLI